MDDKTLSEHFSSAFPPISDIRWRALAEFEAVGFSGSKRRRIGAMLFNCATGLKYPLPPQRRTLDRYKPIDFAAL